MRIEALAIPLPIRAAEVVPKGLCGALACMCRSLALEKNIYDCLESGTYVQRGKTKTEQEKQEKLRRRGYKERQGRINEFSR